MRTDRAGDLCAADIGREVVVCGWVDSRRDHGGVVFLDVRDVAGVVQVVVDPDGPAGEHAHEVRGEFVVRVPGTVRARPEGTVHGIVLPQPDPDVPVRDRGLLVLLARREGILRRRAARQQGLAPERPDFTHPAFDYEHRIVDGAPAAGNRRLGVRAQRWQGLSREDAVPRRARPVRRRRTRPIRCRS